MEQIFAFFEWFEVYQFILSPLLIAIFVMGLSLGIFQMIGDRDLRLGLLVPIGGVLLAFSFIGGEFGGELFLNLSAQVFMTLIAVLIVALASQLESWFIPIVLVALITIPLQLFVPLDNIGTNIPTTYGTTLIGALMVAFMLRQEWAWSPVRQEKRLSGAMRKARQIQAESDEQFGDYFMLIAGHDEGTIQQRIDFLKEHDMSIISQEATEYDEESENYYRLIHVKIETVVKNPDTVLLANNEARVQILGFPDTTKRVYKQLGEVLVTREQKRIDAPEPHMTHIEFRVNAPETLYSAVLESKLYELARDWQYGDDESLQVATDHLLEWARAQGLVQK